MINRVLSRLLEEIKKKTSWGKNELIELFARIQAEEIEAANAIVTVQPTEFTESDREKAWRAMREYLASELRP